MKRGFATREELIAFGIFYLHAIGSEALVDPDCEVDDPEDICAWLCLDDIARKYGVAESEIMDGLEVNVAQGVLAVIESSVNPNHLYAALRYDLRHRPGYSPSICSFAVRTLLVAGHGRERPPARVI